MAITTNSFSKEIHKWNYYIPSNATKLYIGTFPSDKVSKQFPFFYSSPTNRFWEIASELIKFLDEKIEELNDIEGKKSTLKKLGVGLTDMGKTVLRQQNSSKDHSLFPLEFMDIIEIINKFPSIETLIVTGSFQMNSSAQWFGTFCELNNIKINLKELDKDKVTTIMLEDKSLKVIRTYSTSRLSRIKTEKIIEEYRNFLF